VPLVHFLIFLAEKLANLPFEQPQKRRRLANNNISEAQQYIFEQENKVKNEQAWRQDLYAECIPIEGRNDLVVLIVSRKDTVIHIAPVEAIEDTDHMPPLRPMPYGRHRTSTGDTKLTEKEELEASSDTQGSSQQEQLDLQLSQ